MLSIDNRGTPAPRGRDWRKCVYRQVGSWPRVSRPSRSRPSSDAGRSSTASGGHLGLERRGLDDARLHLPLSRLYQTGIAIAFVADQRYYDTIYQERYMGRPDDNPEGYKQGSPITHASGLKGHLC